MDDRFAQYPASLMLQKADWNRESKEVRAHACFCRGSLTRLNQMVESLTQMTIERLQLYRKKNRSLPERIIVYRDGVSEVRVSFFLPQASD